MTSSSSAAENHPTTSCHILKHDLPYFMQDVIHLQHSDDDDDGENMACATDDGTIVICNSETGEIVRFLHGHSDGVVSLIELPHGKLASASFDKTIRIWDICATKCVMTLWTHTNWVVSLALLPGGKLASGSCDKTIRIWNVETGACLHLLQEHGNVVHSLTPLPHGKLASASNDHTIRIWDISTGECLRILVEQTSEVTSLSYFPDGRIVSGYTDGAIRIWRTEPQDCLKTLHGHSDMIQIITTFSNDRIITGSSDNTIRIWNARCGCCLGTLEGHSDSVISLAILQDGKLASASCDDTVRIWDISSLLSMKSCPSQTNEDDANLLVSPAPISYSQSFASIHDLYDEIHSVETSMLSSSASSVLDIEKLQELHSKLLTKHRKLISQSNDILCENSLRHSTESQKTTRTVRQLLDSPQQYKNLHSNHKYGMEMMRGQSEKWLQQESAAATAATQIGHLAEQFKELRSEIGQLNNEMQECFNDETVARIDAKISSKGKQLDVLGSEISLLKKQIEDTAQQYYIKIAQDEQEKLLGQKKRSLLNWIRDKRLLKPQCVNSNFQILEVLHRSEFGVLMKACRRKDQTECALKKLPYDTAGAQKVIQNELKALLRFRHHPRVIDVNCVFLSEDRHSLYIEMPLLPCNLLEWLKGSAHGEHSPEQLLQMDTTRTEEEILKVLHQIVEGLNFLHSHGTEHRDLKPWNILLDSDDQVKLIDFGISRDHNRIYQTQFGTIQRDAHTPRYISPDCRTGGNDAPRFSRDLYAFGVILLECLVDPNHVEVVNTLHTTPRDTPEKLLPLKSGLLSGWLRDVCIQLLHVDSVQRPSMAEVHRLFFEKLLQEKNIIRESTMETSVKLSLIKSALQSVIPSGSLPLHEFKNMMQEVAGLEVLRYLSTAQFIPDLMAEWKVSYADQNGIDAGGMGRNLDYVCVKFCMECGFMDIYESGPKFYTPSDITPFESDMNRIGKMMARCVLRQTPLEWKLSPHVFDVLVGREKDSVEYSLSCLYKVDPDLGSNLRRCLRNPTECGFDTLKEAEEAVIDKFKEKIIGTQHRSANTTALKRGFYSCFDVTTRRQLGQLTGQELMLLMCDQPGFNRENFVRVTQQALEDQRWQISESNRQTKEWMVQFVREQPVEVLKLLLVLMSGWPIFHSGTRFSISPSHRTMGHTCFNNMELNCSLESYEQFCRHLNLILCEQEVSGFED